MKRFDVEWQGRVMRAWAERIRGQIWLHVAGETFVFETRTKRRSATAQAETEAHIEAPMPGKVTKVLAQSGESAETGQIMVVMEAMKMEYTLKAKQAGDVTRVLAKVGDQVSLGQRLVEIAPK